MVPPYAFIALRGRLLNTRFTLDLGVFLARQRLIAAGLGLVVLMVGVVATIPLLLPTTPSELRLEEIGQIDTGERASRVAVEGEIAFVLDSTDSGGSLVLINISDPVSPTELSRFSTGGEPMEMDIVGSIVYIADFFQGLKIVNVSDSLNPVEIGEYFGSGTICDVQVVGDLAFVADWNYGLKVLNISDPTSPQYVAGRSTSGACTQVHVDGDLACITNHHEDYTGIKLLNVSDLSYLTQVGELVLSGVDFWDPFMCGGFIYVGNHGLGGGELRILNVSDPTLIEQVGIFDRSTSVFGEFVVENIVYTANYDNGLIILNVSDRTNPMEIARFFDGGNAFDLVVVGDLVFVADGRDGLEIIRLS